MSIENLKEALTRAEECEGYFALGPKSESVIKKAEELLGFDLSEQTKYFFQTVGYLEFFGHEFYGIIKDDFTGQPTGCAVEYALAERKATGLPGLWLPVFFLDDGEMAYLDYSQIASTGEPPVIAGYYNGDEYEVSETLASDLGDYLLELVNIQLDEQ